MRVNLQSTACASVFTAVVFAKPGKSDRILLVTARYHMPRSLTEFRDVMPGVTVVPYQVDPEISRSWWKSLRVLHSEYAKYLAVTVLTAAGLEPGLDRGTPPAESHAAS